MKEQNIATLHHHQWLKFFFFLFFFNGKREDLYEPIDFCFLVDSMLICELMSEILFSLRFILTRTIIIDQTK